MSSPCTLVLVRHGHTAGNASGLDVAMSGWTDLPLNADGIRDAERVALKLAREKPPDVIYSSPLRRALVTARIIRRTCSAPLRVDADLREINCGEADGLSLAQVRSRYPEHWQQNLAQSDPEFRWPEGECYREFRERSLACLQRVSLAHARERIVVVTHAGIIGQIMGVIHGSSAARWETFRPRNGSITELTVSADWMRVLRFDDLPGAVEEEVGPESGAPRSAA